MRMFQDPQAVYLHREPIDFRAGIDGLAARVEQTLGLSPLTGALFLFTNRRRDRVKILYPIFNMLQKICFPLNRLRFQKLTGDAITASLRFQISVLVSPGVGLSPKAS